ncbi:MAG: hypothetical protein K9N51_10395 [Candidatus Pacebacteria bacterium]|nr:hypothetical protein [Candidatus Paceibacterota bacterium]
MTQKQAIVFGAGNIGRGFIGQLFSESGYHVVFADIDRTLVDALNAANTYRLQTVFGNDVQDYTIAPVSAVDASDMTAVAEATATADVAATAVGSNALPKLAAPIAQAIRIRAGRGTEKPLNTILCENKKGAADFLRAAVLKELPREFHSYVHERIGFVDTVIGRMVPVPTVEMQTKDPTLIRVEPYKELPVNASQFVGAIPDIVAMQPENNFSRFTARKLYIHNCGHALLAYGGYLLGYEYGYEALDDPAMQTLVRGGLQESKVGVAKMYGASAEWLQDHIDDLLRRFRNRALGDTIARLGRDPTRKLGAEDRLVGAARLAEEAGAVPVYLSLGIAAAFFYNADGDPTAPEIQHILQSSGPETVLKQICGLEPKSRLASLILRHYRKLQTGTREKFRQLLEKKSS